MKITETQHRIFSTGMYVLALVGTLYYGYRGVSALYNKYTTPKAEAANNYIYTASPFSQGVYGTANPLMKSDFSAKDSRVNVTLAGQNGNVVGWQISGTRGSTKVNNDQSGYYGQQPVYYPTYPSNYPNYPTYPTYPTNPTYPTYPTYPSYPSTYPTYPTYPSTSSRYPTNNNNTVYLPAGPIPADYFNCFTNESIYYSDYCNSQYARPNGPIMY